MVAAIPATPPLLDHSVPLYSMSWVKRPHLHATEEVGPNNQGTRTLEQISGGGSSQVINRE